MPSVHFGNGVFVTRTTGLPSTTVSFSVLVVYRPQGSYPTDFMQVFGLTGAGGIAIGIDSDELNANVMAAYVFDGTFQALDLSAASSTAWLGVAFTHDGAGTAYKVYKVAEGDASATLVGTLDVGVEGSYTAAYVGDGVAIAADVDVTSFGMVASELTSGQVFTALTSLARDGSADNTWLPFNSAATAGTNLGTSGAFTVTGTPTNSTSEPAAPFFPGYVAVPPGDLAPMRYGSGRISAASIGNVSGAAALLPLATMGAGTSWYAQEQRVAVRRRQLPEPNTPPVVPAASAPTLTWFAHSPARIKTSAGTDGGADSIPPLNPVTGTWFPDAPDRAVLRRYLRDEPGSGLVLTLTTNAVVFVQPDAAWTQRKRTPVPDGSGFGERPLYLANMSWAAPGTDVLRGKRAVFEDRSVSPLTAVVTFADLSWATQEIRPAWRRARVDDIPALPLGGLGSQDLSWALQASAGARFRPSVGGQDVPVLLPVFQGQAPGWLPQPADVVRKLVRYHADGPLLLPVFQVQVPSWLPQPADVVRRDIKPDDRGSGPLLTAMAQAQDLSWAVQGADPARRRAAVFQDPSMVPVGTAVVLSPWGWIPEAEPARKGRKVVDPTPVSALVPPIIVTAMPWGWLPEGPARPAPRVVRSELASWLVQPLAATPVTSWFPDSSDRPVRARAIDLQVMQVLQPIAPSSASWYPIGPDQIARRLAARGMDAIEPLGPGKSPWGWMQGLDPVQFRGRRPDGGFSALVDVPRQAGLYWLAEQAHVIAARQRRAGEAVLPPQALSDLSPTSWFPWSRDVVALRPRPQGIAELPLLPVVLVPLSAISWMTHDPGRAAPRVLAVLDWAAMPLSAGDAPRVPSARYALFPALSTMLVTWEDD